MREKTEADIDILKLRDEYWQGDFKEKFCKFIIEHYLRKFHCFYLHLTHLTTFIHINTGESASGNQVLELEQKHEKKFTWLEKMMLKIHRG